MPVTVLGLSFLWLTHSGERGSLTAFLNATPLALVAALGLRFGAVFFAVGQSALDRRTQSHIDTLRTFGRTGIWSFLRLLSPFLETPVAAASAYVFLESLKDLSLTLLLQPFGFGTVNTRLFQYANTGRVRECAVLVICLILLGLFPLVTLMRAVGGRGRMPVSLGADKEKIHATG
jgi:iron(III) transport system permease protein